MELDVKKVLAQAQQTVLELTYEIWLLKAQVETLKENMGSDE